MSVVLILSTVESSKDSFSSSSQTQTYINKQNEFGSVNEFTSFNSDHVEEIVLRASEVAQEMVKSVDDESGDEEDGFIAEEEGEEQDDNDADDEADFDDYDDNNNNNNQYEDIHDGNDDEEDIYYDHPSDDDQPSTLTFESVQSTSYSGLRLVQSVPATNLHNYFPVYIHKKNPFLHKATAAWYMQEKQAHLPADRLQRVQFKKT